MDAAALIFSQPPATSGALVFGADDGISTVIADNPARIGLTLSGPAVSVHIAQAVTVSVAMALPGPVVAARGLWDANISRPTVGQTASNYQRATPAMAGHAAHYQRTAALPVGQLQRYRRASPMVSAPASRYQATQAKVQAVFVVYQQASPLSTSPVSSYFESSLRLQHAMATAYQRAVFTSGPPAFTHYQQALRVRSDLGQWFQRAMPVAHSQHSGMGIAVPLQHLWRSRYQRAGQPRPGQWLPPVVPPSGPRCYIPNAALLFVAPIAANGALLFICERKTPVPPGPGPQQPPNYVLKILRRGYMTVHHLTAQLLPSLEAVKLRNITIASDDDSFCWSLSASGPEHLLDQLAPVGGLPAQIRILIDGIDWVFAIESLTRTRKFAGNGVAVQGRSTTALLGAPYMPESTWGNPDGDYTAQQLVTQALEYTGVEIDWGITDWLVNQGAWSYQGTPLAVAARVAESVGAVLRSHRTLPTLQFAHRYPHTPWEWASAPVNVQMPVSITTTDSLQPTNKPDWNAMYVSGTNYGVLGHIRRAGTAGDVLAPQVTDALITHGDAARQRGRAILGSAGKQMRHTLSLPLLVGVTGATGPVLVEPGYLIEVIEKKETWRGQVRAVSVSANLPLVRQSITVERHAA
jgi:hypothetical protein